MVLRIFPTQDSAGQYCRRTAAASPFCNNLHSAMPSHRVCKTCWTVSSVCGLSGPSSLTSHGECLLEIQNQRHIRIVSAGTREDGLPNSRRNSSRHVKS